MFIVAVLPSTTVTMGFTAVGSASSNSSRLVAVVEYHRVTVLASSDLAVTVTGALNVPPSGVSTGVASGALAFTVTVMVTVCGLNSSLPANTALIVTVCVEVT